MQNRMSVFHISQGSVWRRISILIEIFPYKKFNRENSLQQQPRFVTIIHLLLPLIKMLFILTINLNTQLSIHSLLFLLIISNKSLLIGFKRIIHQSPVIFSCSWKTAVKFFSVQRKLTFHIWGILTMGMLNHGHSFDIITKVIKQGFEDFGSIRLDAEPTEHRFY